MEAATTTNTPSNDPSRDTAPSHGPAAALLAWVDANRRWLFTAMVVLYLACFTGRWRVSPDNALYMSLGRNLAEGSGFVYHGVKHTWFEPGLPLVIAGVFQTFGEDNYVPILAFLLGCSLASLFLAYRLMLRHAGRPTAVLVTLGMGLCETCLRYGFQVVTDTPFLVALLIYLIGYERLVRPRSPESGRDKHAWLGWAMLPVGMILMVMFRPTSITFVGAVGLACAWHLLRGPNRWKHVLIGVVTLGCFLGFRHFDPRRQGATESVVREQRLKDLLTTQRSYAIHRIATVTLPDFFEEIVPEAIFGTEIAPGVDTVLTVAVIAAGLSLTRRRVLWGAWAAATFFQSVAWLPRERYLLPILPFIVYGLWLGVSWITSRPQLSPKTAKLALAGMLILYFGPNLAYELKFAVEQRSTGINREGKGDPSTESQIAMAKQIAAFTGEKDIIFATDHREMSYFSRRRVEGSPWSYRWPPTEAQEKEFFERIVTVPALYAVLPDTTSEPHVVELMKKLNMQIGEPLATVERPADRRGKPQEPFKLYRLVHVTLPSTGPTTRATVRE